MKTSQATKESKIVQIEVEKLRPVFETWAFLPQANEFRNKSDAVDAYLAELQSRQDLRVFTDGNGWYCGIRSVGWDSNHFGIPMGQLEPVISNAPSDNFAQSIEQGVTLINRCLEEARKMGLTHISVAIDTGDPFALAALQQAGFELMDTLANYWMKPKDIPRVKVSDNVRICRLEDVENIADYSGLCFSDRAQNLNRFNVDPALPHEKVHELYRVWVHNSFNKTVSDEVLVYEENGIAVGFISFLNPINDPKRIKIARFTLNAVSPEYQGRRFNGKLIDGALSWLLDQGSEIIEIKTQVSNTAVHIAWSKRGARLINAVYRLRKDLNK